MAACEGRLSYRAPAWFRRLRTYFETDSVLLTHRLKTVRHFLRVAVLAAGADLGAAGYPKIRRGRLDQEFNSPRAQREVAKADIQGQRPLRRTLVPQHCAEGGFTVGNLDPASAVDERITARSIWYRRLRGSGSNFQSPVGDGSGETNHLMGIASSLVTMGAPTVRAAIHRGVA